MKATSRAAKKTPPVEISDLAECFGSNLKRARLKKHWSQEHLAAEAEFSVSYVSMLERGQRDPPLSTLAVFAKTLETTAAALVWMP